MTIGRIQGIEAGEYTVVLGHPNGYNQTLSLSTTSVTAAPPAAALPAAEVSPEEATEEQAESAE